MNKIYFTWDDINKATDNIVAQIEEKGMKPDFISGIPRGGLIIAVILSHKLNIPFVLNPISSSAKQLLIVDDISDTGKTLKKYFEQLYPTFNCKRPISASIHIAPNTTFIPDVYVHKTKGEWIVYPWETENTSKVDNH